MTPVRKPFPPIRLLAARIRAGELSPVDLVHQCLDRIEQLESKLRAWVLVDAAGAEQQAQAVTAELAAGHDRGPLHGIPVGIKDIIDVRGFATRAGSPMLHDAPPAGEDATLVARLRAAGAIILGKTVTTEFASFDPPPTRNPWNLQRSPGGSSSGSAAGVAAGMCVAAIGSQTGGSITRPASFCGVAGCKPTHGLVSAHGLVPLSPIMDHPGPIAGCVDDLAIVLRAIAGHDPHDAFSADEPWNMPEALSPQRPRLVVLDDFFELADPVAAKPVAAALEMLAAHGVAMVHRPMPAAWQQVFHHHRLLMAADAAACHRATFPARRGEYGKHIAQLLDEGHRATGIAYSQALAYRRRFRRAMQGILAEGDALVLPATVTTATPLDTTGDPRCNSPWSFAGLPTVSVPCGLAADGLPVSLQLVGRAFCEGPLMEAAAWCEAALRLTAIPPIPD